MIANKRSGLSVDHDSLWDAAGCFHCSIWLRASRSLSADCGVWRTSSGWLVLYLSWWCSVQSRPTVRVMGWVAEWRCQTAASDCASVPSSADLIGCQGATIDMCDYPIAALRFILRTVLGQSNICLHWTVVKHKHGFDSMRCKCTYCFFKYRLYAMFHVYFIRFIGFLYNLEHKLLTERIKWNILPMFYFTISI